MEFIFKKLTPVWDNTDVDINKVVDFLFDVYSIDKFGESGYNHDINIYINILKQYFRTHIEFIFKELGYIKEDEGISGESSENIYGRLEPFVVKQIVERLDS